MMVALVQSEEVVLPGDDDAFCTLSLSTIKVKYKKRICLSRATC